MFVYFDKIMYLRKLKSNRIYQVAKMDLNSYNVPLSKGEKERITRFLNNDLSKENELRAIKHFFMFNPSYVSAHISTLRKKVNKIEKNKRKKEEKLKKKESRMMCQSSRMYERYREAKKCSKSNDLIIRTVPWNAIVFENGQVEVYNSRCDGELLLKRYKLVIGCKESRRSFNRIKKLFVNRLPKVRAYMKNDFIVRLVSDLDIRNAITVLKEADSNEEWESNDKPILIPSSYNAICQIDNEQVLRALRRKKSIFLDFLVSKQEPHRNVVPCNELLSYKDSSYEEEAFIFSLKSSHPKLEVLILENVNVARSTIVFLALKDSYDQALRVIFDFIRSNELNKRQRLHYRRFDFSKSGIKIYININHSFVHEWISKIEIL